MNWQDMVLPLSLATIAAALPGIVALFRGKKQKDADVAKAITEAAGKIIEEYKDQLDRIEVKLEKQAGIIRCQELKLKAQDVKIEAQSGRIRDLELERDEILTGVMMLCTQIHDLGQDPVWEPELSEEQ